MKLFLKRLVQLVGFLSLVLVLAIVALNWYQPKVPRTVFPAPKPVSGAAIFYNQAFAQMPELSKEEKKLVYFKPDQTPDYAASVKLLEKCEQSFRLMEQGAKEPECEWGLNLSLGPAMPCPQARGLKLAQVLCFLRARVHMEQGNASAAADDLLLIFRFGRQLEEPELLINSLIRFSTDMIAITFATRHLSEFDDASLRKLFEGIIALPPAHPMREVVATERKMWVAYLNNLLAKAVINATKNKHAAQSLPLPDEMKGVDVQNSKPNQAITITGGLPAKYLAYSINRYEQKSIELENLMGLPYVQARPQLDAFERNLKNHRWLNGIYAILLLPADAVVRRKEVQIETAWTILRTALVAQMRNPASVRGELAKLRDPYDDGPMEWRDVPDGVEVKMKAPPGQKTITLIVGLSGK